MTIEVTPVGIKCNLSCTYCYQNPMREAGNFSAPLDFVGMKKTLKDSGGSFALFGGEPFLTPIDQLKDLWKYGYERFGMNGVQTNGLILTDEHLEAIKAYNVHMGVSIDGPPICNTPRCGKDTTRMIEENILKLLKNDVRVSLIITIHRINAWHMLDLLDWCKAWKAAGLDSFNFHNLEVESKEIYDEIGLDNISTFLAFKAIYEDFDDVSRISPFRDMIELLTNDDPKNTNCTWNACDPLTTPAVQGISADGSLSNCGRTNKEGVDWRKARGGSSSERYQVLYRTPYDYGGCKDCRYFYACKGQCPGTAIDGDWRNRTRDCTFWYMLFDHIETDLRQQGK
jgi:uncharacterized protein